jgi:hypothetical protein
MGKEVAVVEGGRHAGARAPSAPSGQRAPASVVAEGRSGLACLSFR